MALIKASLLVAALFSQAQASYLQNELSFGHLTTYGSLLSYCYSSKSNQRTEYHQIDEQYQITTLWATPTLRRSSPTN